MFFVWLGLSALVGFVAGFLAAPIFAMWLESKSGNFP